MLHLLIDVDAALNAAGIDTDGAESTGFDYENWREGGEGLVWNMDAVDMLNEVLPTAQVKFLGHASKDAADVMGLSAYRASGLQLGDSPAEAVKAYVEKMGEDDRAVVVIANHDEDYKGLTKSARVNVVRVNPHTGITRDQVEEITKVD